MDIKNLQLQRSYEGEPQVLITLSKGLESALQSVHDKFKATIGKKPWEIEIHAKKKKRSLDSNAYAWQLITKIAEKIDSDKDSVYLHCLKSYGQQGIVKIPNDHVENFKRAWKYSEEHEKMTDKTCVYMRFWVGSSNYNTEEMSQFINGVVEDAKDLGIETMTPGEIDKLKEMWRN